MAPITRIRGIDLPFPHSWALLSCFVDLRRVILGQWALHVPSRRPLISATDSERSTLLYAIYHPRNRSGHNDRKATATVLAVLALGPIPVPCGHDRLVLLPPHVVCVGGFDFLEGHKGAWDGSHLRKSVGPPSAIWVIPRDRNCLLKCRSLRRSPHEDADVNRTLVRPEKDTRFFQKKLELLLSPACLPCMTFHDEATTTGCFSSLSHRGLLSDHLAPQFRFHIHQREDSLVNEIVYSTHRTSLCL
jgi:hypothetical protein